MAKNSIVKSLFALAGMAVVSIAIGGSISPARSASDSPLKVIYQFCGNCEPNPGLARDSAGNLYGTTESGGVHNGGIVFRLSPPNKGRTWDYKVLYNFCAVHDCLDGRYPSGSLIIDQAGTLYGTTRAGGYADDEGTAFKLKKDAHSGKWAETVIYNFCTRDSGCSDGTSPVQLNYAGQSTGAPYDGVSALYGIASSGGKHLSGIVFELSQHNGKLREKTLYAFCAQGGSSCTDGSIPTGGLLIGSDGNIYGVTYIGGQANAGTAFKLVPGTEENWNFTTIYNFCSVTGCPDGAHPDATLTMDNLGNLYGPAYGGGVGGGVIFKIATDNTESVVYTFCSELHCHDGNGPGSSLIADGAGNLFGTTYYGGRGNTGVIFKISDGDFSVVQKFCKRDVCSKGAYPESLLLEPSGNFIGLTAAGGKGQGGIAFKWTPPG